MLDYTDKGQKVFVHINVSIDGEKCLSALYKQFHCFHKDVEYALWQTVIQKTYLRNKNGFSGGDGGGGGVGVN